MIIIFSPPVLKLRQIPHFRTTHTHARARTHTRLRGLCSIASSPATWNKGTSLYDNGCNNTYIYHFLIIYIIHIHGALKVRAHAKSSRKASCRRYLGGRAVCTALWRDYEHGVVHVLCCIRGGKEMLCFQGRPCQNHLCFSFSLHNFLLFINIIRFIAWLISTFFGSLYVPPVSARRRWESSDWLLTWSVT